MGLHSGFEDDGPSSPSLGFQMRCRNAFNAHFSSPGKLPENALFTGKAVFCSSYLFMLAFVFA